MKSKKTKEQQGPVVDQQIDEEQNEPVLFELQIDEEQDEPTKTHVQSISLQNCIYKHPIIPLKCVSLVSVKVLL